MKTIQELIGLSSYCDGMDAVEPPIMRGLTMASVEVDQTKESMLFTSTCGRQFLFRHDQDCCERVAIDDIAGDLPDLVGYTLLVSEEVSSLDGFVDTVHDSYDDSHTWTFYKFATVKGYVTVKWLGESNGYYSESVSMYEVKLR